MKFLIVAFIVVLSVAVYGKLHESPTSYVVCRNDGFVTWKGLTSDSVQFNQPCEFTGNTGVHYACEMCLDGEHFW